MRSVDTIAFSFISHHLQPDLRKPPWGGGDIFQEIILTGVAHENEVETMKITKHFHSGFKKVFRRHFFLHLRIKGGNRENPVNRLVSTPRAIFGSLAVIPAHRTYDQKKKYCHYKTLLDSI